MGMDPELIARISFEHQRRLAWFEEHQGEVTPSPAPLGGGLRLVSTPKGIYKPADLPYALSIKIKLDSPYKDGVPVPTVGGGWLLEYHQENPDPPPRDTMFTNRGLMRCIADRVPVGVLRERAPASHHSRYDVLGLAIPVRCGQTGASTSRALTRRRYRSSTR
jgi:putative restriction endonuclease